MGCFESKNVQTPHRQPSFVMRNTPSIVRRNNSPLFPSKTSSIPKSIQIQTMPKAKFVPKEPNWNDKNDNELECIICLEIKKNSSISNCCMNIICNDCTKNINGTCPLRCKKLSKQFKTSNLLNKRINKVFSLCDVCFAEVHPWDMDQHQETCGDHIVGESVKDSW